MIDKKIQEQLRKQYNPDGSQLRTIQLCLLDILIEFDRVCRKNGISYWIDSGTLIGAARHGGFIPWDDDLDVCILRKDRKRVAQALTRDLREPFICEPDRRQEKFLFPVKSRLQQSRTRTYGLTSLLSITVVPGYQG